MTARLRRKYSDQFEYHRDVERIVSVFRRFGFEIGHHEAMTAWEDYSGSMCAGWLCLPDDDKEIFAPLFQTYFEMVPEPLPFDEEPTMTKRSKEP